MRIREFSVLSCWLLAGWLLPAAVLDAQAEEIRDLAARADALMRLGVAEKGASRAFDEASAMLMQAEELTAGADLSPASREALNLEIEAVRDDLGIEHRDQGVGQREGLPGTRPRDDQHGI